MLYNIDIKNRETVQDEKAPLLRAVKNPEGVAPEGSRPSSLFYKIKTVSYLRVRKRKIFYKNQKGFYAYKKIRHYAGLYRIRLCGIGYSCLFCECLYKALYKIDLTFFFIKHFKKEVLYGLACK